MVASRARICAAILSIISIELIEIRPTSHLWAIEDAHKAGSTKIQDSTSFAISAVGAGLILLAGVGVQVGSV
jgi:hypothetical protein